MPVTFIALVEQPVCRFARMPLCSFGTARIGYMLPRRSDQDDIQRFDCVVDLVTGFFHVFSGNTVTGWLVANNHSQRPPSKHYRWDSLSQVLES